MKITRTSMFSGVTRTLDLPITQEQVTSWESGTLIQKAMPQLSKDQREFVMTGITAQEWDNEFGGEEDSLDRYRVEAADGDFNVGIAEFGTDVDLIPFAEDDIGADEVDLLSLDELEDLSKEYD
jgi:hypothetical protein